MAKDELFGKAGYYPIKAPARPPARFGTRSFRTWSAVGRTMVWSPIWMVGVNLGLYQLTGIWLIWLSMIATVIVWAGVAFGTAAHFETLPAEERRFLPEWIKSFMNDTSRQGIKRPEDAETKLARYEPRELKLLEALWQLNEGIDKLEQAARQLKSQVKDDHGQESAKLEEEARTALAGGNAELARSLVESALAHEKHQDWLEEQHERILVQLRFLQAKQSNLKARLSLIHTQRESLKAQRAAAEARAAVGEMMAGFPDVGLDLDDGLELERLRDEALDAEARALAMEELADQALLESGGDPQRQLESLSLSTEVEERLRALLPLAK